MIADPGDKDERLALLTERQHEIKKIELALKALAN